MADISAKIGADISELRGDLKRASSEFRGFATDVSRQTLGVGKIFKGVFSATIIADFAKQSIRALADMAISAVELADSAKAVVPAFERLGDPNLLSSLVEATGESVSNLDLMKRAVQAKNLGVPVRQLATFFEFATIRARETGESVKKLTENIVTGIGRKSPLILDNLGISAARLKEEMGGVSSRTAEVGDVAAAVGRIIKEEMGGANTTVGDVVSSADQLNTVWENMKTELGEELLPTVREAQTALVEFLKSVDVKALVQDVRDLIGWFAKLGEVALQLKSIFTLGLDTAFVNAILDGVELIPKKVKEVADSVKLSLDQIGDGFIELSPVTLEWTGAIAGAENAIKLLNTQIKNASASELPALGAELDAAKFKLLELQELVSGEGITGGIIPTVERANVNLPDKSELGLFDPQEQIEQVTLQTEPALAEIQRFTDQANALVSQAAANVFTGLGEGIADAVSGITGGLNAILGIFGDFVKQFGELLIAYGTATAAFKNAFGNPFAAIAAGVALVAIGGVIKNLLSKGPSVPSLAIGTNLVQSDGIAQLHRGEAVVPAQVAGGGFTGQQTVKIVGDGVRYDGKHFVLAFKAAERDLGRSR